VREGRTLPFTAYPKPWKQGLLLVVCLSFVAVGLFVVKERSTMLWFSTGFFALGALIFLVQLVPGSSYLTVDHDGIETCTLFRKTRYRWSDLSDFGVYQVRMNKFVGFNFAPHYQLGTRGRAFSRAMMGYEGALPDTYGFKAEELAEILAHHHSIRTSG
jgi:hypothetical protein